MCDVMSSSGVVVGVCATWCAAWDGFLKLHTIILLFRVGTAQIAASRTLKMWRCWNLLRTKLFSRQNKEIIDRNHKSLYIQ